MALDVVFQMDEISSINIKADSTFLLALEAQKRGHNLFYYRPEQLALKNGEVIAAVQSLDVRNNPKDFFSLGEKQPMALKNADVVLLRQDPPFDMRYITNSYLLERIHPETLVVNNPKEVRNAPEKIAVCNFPEFMPDTLITEDKDEIRAFAKEYGDIIIKPLYGCGGADVFLIKKGDKNLDGVLDILGRSSACPLIAQQFIPQISKGDKRIIIVDGKPLGAVTRMPAEHSVRANFHAGGAAHKAVLTARDKEICEAIAPMLKENGLLFVGIDIIGDYITEINVTSPTGLHEINRLDGVQLESGIWDAIEQKL